MGGVHVVKRGVRLVVPYIRGKLTALVSSSLIKSGKSTDSPQVISRSQERYRPSAYITLNLKQEAHPYSS